MKTTQPGESGEAGGQMMFRPDPEPHDPAARVRDRLDRLQALGKTEPLDLAEAAGLAWAIGSLLIQHGRSASRVLPKGDAAAFKSLRRLYRSPHVLEAHVRAGFARLPGIRISNTKPADVKRTASEPETFDPCHDGGVETSKNLRKEYEHICRS